jgi:hypothetical protein
VVRAAGRRGMLAVRGAVMARQCPACGRTFDRGQQFRWRYVLVGHPRPFAYYARRLRPYCRRRTCQDRATLDYYNGIEDEIERHFAGPKPKRRMRWAVPLLIAEVRRLTLELEDCQIQRDGFLAALDDELNGQGINAVEVRRLRTALAACEGIRIGAG